MLGQYCFISLDGMDFNTQEPWQFNPMGYSHKFKGPGGQYEVGRGLQMGSIIWWNGAFPCGLYADVNIAQQWLIYELDDDIHKVGPADGGYNDGGEYFFMPSGQSNYVFKMMVDGRARHKAMNKLLKDYNMLQTDYNMLQNIYRGQLEWHHYVFGVLEHVPSGFG